MKFKEYLVTNSDNTAGSAAVSAAGIPAASKNKVYENCKQLIVKIMPAHPYQYLLHGELKSLLIPEIIQSIKKKYHIELITFIITTTQAHEYNSVLSQTDCEVIYSKAHYPFALEKVLKISGEHQLIDWFEFIILAKSTVGKHITHFPVSVTLFGADEKRWITNGPLTISEIAEQAGILSEEYIFSDHPYTGSVVKSDKKIDELCAHEILIYPKVNSRKRSLLKNIVSKFLSQEQNIGEIFKTDNIYENKPCQKCLKCVSICPEELTPFMLSAISERGSLKEAMELQIDRCSECGLCSSTCPSRIPIMQNIQKLKKEL